MSTLSKRVVVRISDELEQWIGAQAENEGLDSATWVRSMLTRMKNGLVTAQLAQKVQPVRDSSPEPEQLADEPAEPIDTDAMVSEALDIADAQGLTAPREDPEPPIQTTGVRSLVRRPPPFSGAGATPAFIKDHFPESQ